MTALRCPSFLVLLLTSLAPLAAQAAPPPANAADAIVGEWRGSIRIPGSPLEVFVTLAGGATADGGWRGTIDIPAQGAKALALEAIAVTGTKATFRIAGIPGAPTFAGELATDGGTLAGEFTQGAARFPFTLQRAAAAAADLVGRFAPVAAWLDATREGFDVPGCAVAIVKDGAVLTRFTSGRRDVARDLPVTDDTLFAIGSSSKAFTTCLLAMLVADGKLAWDEPVRARLPEFQLADAALGERVTLRDLVTHRTGMPRHDLVWYGANVDRLELVRRLRHLPLSRDLRAEFQYNNLMLLTAGVVAERVGEASWEELVRTRLFTPLGMVRSGFSVAAMADDGDHALAYDWRDGKVEAVPYRDVSTIGPAGSINSTAREMANWLAFLLQRGSFAGHELLPPAALADLMQPRMPVDQSSPVPEVLGESYACAWFVDAYRGHRRVRHGGNIDGFSALVALLPDDGFGFVVLSNLDGTPFPEVVVRQLSDLALQLEARDWSGMVREQVAAARRTAATARGAAAGERVAGTRPSHDLADYAGDYADAGYGPLHVELRDGALQVDLHGLTVPLRHWHYDVFAGSQDAGADVLRGLRFQFTSDVDGAIDAVAAVLEPHVPPIRFARRPDPRCADPVFLDALTGDWQVDDQTLRISRQNDRLVLDLPGQHYVLEPRPGLVFGLSGLAGYSVRIELGAGERPTALVFRQPDGVHRAERPGAK